MICAAASGPAIDISSSAPSDRSENDKKEQHSPSASITDASERSKAGASRNASSADAGEIWARRKPSRPMASISAKRSS